MEIRAFPTFAFLLDTVVLMKLPTLSLSLPQKHKANSGGKKGLAGYPSLPAAFLLGYLGDPPLLCRAPGKLAFDFRSRGGGGGEGLVVAVGVWGKGERKGKRKRKVVRGVLLRLRGGVSL